MRRSSRLLRILVMGFILVASAAAISGCNTMGGAGKDIKNAGQSIEDAAD